ncbi:MAG: hypothetical protein LQ346_004870, partial [Caloplaca aetnensis]
GLTNDGGYKTVTTMAPPDPMREAINNALFNSDVSLSAVAGTCPTGNCTWDPYRSLRIHASVVDMTKSIVTDCPNNRDQAETDCMYSLPEIEKHPTWLKSRMQPKHQVVWVGASDTTGGYEYEDVATLAEFYVICLPYATGNYASLPEAYKGTLSFGLSTLRTSIESGITVTTESDLMTDLDWQETDETLFEDTSFSTISTTAPGNPEVFWIDRNSSMCLRQYLSNILFTGNGQLDAAHPTGGINYTTNSTQAVGESLYYRAGFTFYGLSERLDILAVGITNGSVFLSTNLILFSVYLVWLNSSLFSCSILRTVIDVFKSSHYVWGVLGTTRGTCPSSTAGTLLRHRMGLARSTYRHSTHDPIAPYLDNVPQYASWDPSLEVRADGCIVSTRSGAETQARRPTHECKNGKAVWWSEGKIERR